MLHVCAHWQVCLPLHPEHWMKKLMRSRREESLSDPYASIQSSITACSGSKEDPVNHNIIMHHQESSISTVRMWDFYSLS